MQRVFAAVEREKEVTHLTIIRQEKLRSERYYLVEDWTKDLHPQSGDGVGKWIVRDKSQGNLKWLGGLCSVSGSSP